MTGPGNDFASRLNYLRKIKGLSSKDLAEIAKVSTTSVSNWLNRGVIPNNDALQKLSHKLDTTIEYLLIGDKPRGTLSSILDKAAEEIAAFEGIPKDSIVLKLEIINCCKSSAS